MEQTYLIGNLLYEPEMRFTINGKAVCSFKLKDSKGEVHRITTWEELAEACNQQLEIGNRISVKGKARIREYTNFEGKKQYYPDFTAYNVYLLAPDDGNTVKILKEIENNATG